MASLFYRMINDPSLVSVESSVSLGLYEGDTAAAERHLSTILLLKKRGGVYFFNFLEVSKPISEFCIFRYIYFFHRILISDKCRCSLGYGVNEASK